MSSPSLIEFVIPVEERGDRLDRAIKSALDRGCSSGEQITESMWTLSVFPSSPSTKSVKGWIESGWVRVMGTERCRASDRVKGGERVILTLPEFSGASSENSTTNHNMRPMSKRERRAKFWNTVWEHSQSSEIEPATIIYLDEEVLVLDKPIAIPTAPTLDPRRESLYHRALRAIIDTQQNSNLDTQRSEAPYLRVIHRLDRDTSGLVVMARSSQSARILSDIFEQRQVEKRYLVRCVYPSEGELYRYLNQWNCSELKHIDPFKYEAYMAEEHQSPKGEHHQPCARSRWRVVEHGGLYSRTDFTLVSRDTDHLLLQAQLYTGRTHQIRVHLASLQAPILGDTLYNFDHSKKAHRLCLHAHELCFKHPLTQVSLHLESKPKPQFFI